MTHIILVLSPMLNYLPNETRKFNFCTSIYLSIKLHGIVIATLRVCLNFEKLKGKKKILKVTFFLLFGLRKVKRKKIEKKNVRTT